MKVNRNYRFVLTVVNNDQISTGKIRVDNCAVTGERMFVSECHYYAEKELISAVKDAEKRGMLGEYYSHTYLIYRENKPQIERIEREEGDKKIVEIKEIPGTAMLIETIAVDENGINIR